MHKKIAFALTLLLFFQFSCKDKNNIPKGNKKNKLDIALAPEITLNKTEYKGVYDSINGAFKIKKLNKALKRQFLFKKLNGCVLIQQAGVTLINECYGNTCLRCKDGEELTPYSVFQLASVSKTFTAIATMKLVEQKKLRLADSVQKFYPDFPFHGITVEQLLSHRSGLPNYLYSFDDSSKTAVSPDNQKIMEWFTKAKPAMYGVPGKSFSYNNSNYAVLAALIEKASGKKYTEYLEKAIFKPLKMNHTYVVNAIPDSVSRTVGHERFRKIKKDFFDEVFGDKGIYSCTNDLLIWYKALKNNRILSSESMKKVFTPRSFERPGVKNYGLGFRMILENKSKKPKYIYHNGWWKGYSTLFWFDPETEAFITILSNERNKATYKTTKLINVLNNVD